MSTMTADGQVYEESAGSIWWVFLITGTAWLILSLIMFRFNITSAKSIGVLAGIVFLCAGVIEIGMVAVVHGGWWKALNAILALLLIVGGIMSFIHPENTFVAIASIIGFMFLFVGILDLIIAFSDRTGPVVDPVDHREHLHRARVLGVGRLQPQGDPAHRLGGAVLPVPGHQQLHRRLHGAGAREGVRRVARRS